MNIDLKNLLSTSELSRKDKILSILLAKNEELPVKTIKELAIENGLRESTKWNISQLLSDLNSHAVKLPNGWSITEKGKNYLNSLNITDTNPTQILKPALRKHISSIKNLHTKQFADEAITALEYGLLRAAVVLSWVGAVAILYEEILKNHLSNFNTEASNRFPKWKTAINADDLSKMKEFEFLQILNTISVIGKNVKDELEQCLKLRNSCGHPNSLKIGEHKVASHIEILILNVYSKYDV